MASGDKSKGIKSAYELALERLDSQGIERPRESALSGESKRAIASVRQETEAKLAELEILHRDKMKKLDDPVKREEQEEYFRRERERISAEGDSRVDGIRNSS